MLVMDIGVRIAVFLHKNYVKMKVVFTAMRGLLLLIQSQNIGISLKMER